MNDRRRLVQGEGKENVAHGKNILFAIFRISSHQGSANRILKRSDAYPLQEKTWKINSTGVLSEINSRATATWLISRQGSRKKLLGTR
jgi:hypothetical protein